jgi:multidrug resistance efflux pump
MRVLPVVTFGMAALLAASLWVRNVGVPTIVGEVESVAANVASPEAGSLMQLKVDLFQPVIAGEPIALVQSARPEVLSNTLALVRAEIELLKQSMDPVVGRFRASLDYERIRLDGMLQRVELASARAHLTYAEGEYARTQELFKHDTNIVSGDDLDIALRDRDMLRAEVEEKSRLVAAYEDSAQRLALPKEMVQPDPGVQPLRAAIAVEEQKLRLAESQLGPVTLRSPINGLVSKVYRRIGENVVAGEPIVTITALNPERILAYIRQPLTLEPKVGMDVEIRTRTLHRQVAVGKILQVGNKMEPFSAPLRVRGFDQAMERGLPFLVSRPPGLVVHPSELVDLVIKAAP